MLTSGIAIPTAEISVADEFERKADDFAALAEAASSAEECIRYRDLEHGWRLRAAEERLRQIPFFHTPSNDNASVAA